MAVGPGIAGIATKSNNQMVFTTNSSVNTKSISIEANGHVIFFYDILNIATTYLKNTFIDGILKVPLIETTNMLLKLKGGIDGTQILHTDDTLLLEANSVGINML